MASDNFNFPDKEGFFGEYGGKFVPETLMYALEELENTYNKLKDNKDFIDEFYKDLSAFVGRPSPLYFAQRLTDYYGSGSIWLKREDLNHTGAHKINNTVGQILLAKHMGKKRIIAETGAGQHEESNQQGGQFERSCHHALWPSDQLSAGLPENHG